MQYYSLQHQAPNVSFKEAVLKGQAPDKGLYFPTELPKLPADFIKNLATISKEEVGYTVMRPYVGEDMTDQELKRIVAETVNFDFPLVKINDQIASLELFHGPTYAFKDVGARFMSRCLGHFHKNENKKTTILVATSGDTGGAVANGFLGVEGVEVIILYPSGKVSPIQELQLTTCGKNITALEIEGSFDDCQAIVKQAFMDQDLKEAYQLTSANSINVGRWLPQQLYYFYGLQQWQQQQPPVICVPSGNFGNICAGILAHISGLPVQHFIAACNVNDTVPVFMQTGNYQPKASTPTISNAMDVGNPSNFGRILEIFGGEAEKLKTRFSSVSITDDQTKATIKEVYGGTGYLLDPHGAVAYRALADYQQQNPSQKGFILETAHPVKFPDVIESLLDIQIPLPEGATALNSQDKVSVKLAADFDSVKNWLLGR
ncbi:threonine synthase [Arachidicoccus rhizosphaerae]|jgi:threonine synthase|uniref:Threonine synthase n=1 Tax=Arachidicoccus rhizosphaerae TaxID=551991 RepID=A0A1H4C0E3_9BACT|nr:threonine synthase [Arachidicoccus rhizosphaerae]SEA53783.1 threonine synthase [Arachidicoccus rhizosphaerae]